MLFLVQKEIYLLAIQLKMKLQLKLVVINPKVINHHQIKYQVINHMEIKILATNHMEIKIQVINHMMEKMMKKIQVINPMVTKNLMIKLIIVPQYHQINLVQIMRQKNQIHLQLVMTKMKMQI